MSISSEVFLRRNIKNGDYVDHREELSFPFQKLVFQEQETTSSSLFIVAT
jgi:hypothetical protein